MIPTQNVTLPSPHEAVLLRHLVVAVSRGRNENLSRENHSLFSFLLLKLLSSSSLFSHLRPFLLSPLPPSVLLSFGYASLHSIPEFYIQDMTVSSSLCGLRMPQELSFTSSSFTSLSFTSLLLGVVGERGARGR